MLRRIGLVTLIPDRFDAGMTGRADGAAWELGLHELREAETVAAEPDSLIDRVRPRLESGHPVEDVIGPARLAVFTVVDDVDARFDLLLHDIHGRLAQRLLVACLLLWLLLRRGGVVEELCGSDQAADVSCQNAIGATCHGLAMRLVRLKPDTTPRHYVIFGIANFGSLCEII